MEKNEPVWISSIHFRKSNYSFRFCVSVETLVDELVRLIKGFYYNYKYIFVFDNCIAIQKWHNPKLLSPPEWCFYFKQRSSIARYCKGYRCKIEEILAAAIGKTTIVDLFDTKLDENLLLNPPKISHTTKTTIYHIEQTLLHPSSKKRNKWEAL